MMKKKSLIVMAVALCLVFAMGAGATLATLSRQSQQVTNTFTVGDGFRADAITLDEAPVDPDTHEADEDAARVQENTYTGIMQGDVLDKDPQVHIAANSAACYMFVKIEGLDALAAAGITADWNAANWVKVDVPEGKLDGIYAYQASGETAPSIIPSSTSVTDLAKLFTELNVADTATLYNQDGTPVSLDAIKIMACAVQSDNQENGYTSALASATFSIQ